jgi:hypothetical protein
VENPQHPYFKGSTVSFRPGVSLILVNQEDLENVDLLDIEQPTYIEGKLFYCHGCSEQFAISSLRNVSPVCTICSSSSFIEEKRECVILITSYQVSNFLFKDLG